MEKQIYIVIVSLLVLFTMISIARAENWVNAATADKNKVETFVDVDSIREEGNKKKFWMYHDMKGKVKSQNGEPIEKAYGHAVVDCEAKTIGYLESIIQWPNGTKDKSREKLDEEPVKPDSVNAGVLKFVCEKKDQ